MAYASCPVKEFKCFCMTYAFCPVKVCMTYAFCPVKGFDRSDSSTWNKWPNRAFGMPPNQKDPVMRPPFMRLRQHPAVVACFAAIMNVRVMLYQPKRKAKP